MENPLTNAVKRRDYNAVVNIYNEDPSLLNRIDSEGRNPVMYSEGNILTFLISCDKCDIYLLDSTGKSLLDILLEKGIKKNNFKLLRSSRTPISFKDIPTINNIILDKKYRDIILYDDLEQFMQEYEYYGDYILLLACQFKAKRIINYLIDLNRGVDYVSNNRFIPLCYSFYYEDDELSCRLYERMTNKNLALLKNIYNEMSTNYGKQCIDLKDKILRSDFKSLELSKSNDFIDVNRRFRMINFEIIKYVRKLESGSSGSIIHVKEKKTGIDFMLKKLELKDGIISSSILQEINIHKFINGLDPNLAVTFYGYFVDGNSLYMVLEYMRCTLEYYLRILKEPKSKVKTIFYELVSIVDRINSLGIIHHDLKSNNIMIDLTGKIKIIDFGLSKFIGLSMSRRIFDDLLVASFIYPPDRQGNINLSYDNNFITLNTNRKTLNIDIFAIAVEIINIFYRKDISVISNKSHIFMIDKMTHAYKTDNSWSFLTPDILNNDFDLYNLLGCMLRSDSKYRFFADQCLSHKYFESIHTSVDRKKESKFISNECKSSLISYSNSIEMEARYKEEMINNFKTLNFLECKDSNIDSDYINSIIYIFNIYKRSKTTSFDILINFINKFHRLISYLEISTELKERVYLLYAVMLYVITEIQFGFKINQHSIFDRVNSILGYNFTMSQLKSIYDSVLSFDSLFTFIPVQTMITYITIKLRELNHQTYNLEIYISTLLLKYITFNNTYDNVWSVISNFFHYLLPGNSYKFLGDTNEYLLDKIKNTITSVSKIDDYDLRSLLV